MQAINIFNDVEVGNLDKRTFDTGELSVLGGKYVYALKDPRDGKIFYIGQGSGDRVFQHFDEAVNVICGRTKATSKTLRIIDIWISAEDVDWLILARNLSPKEADIVESGIIDALENSQNGPCLNLIKGPKSSLILLEDLRLHGASIINPNQPHKRVFVFPIANALAEGRGKYDATRMWWRVTEENRTTKDTFAVGLSGGVSVSAYKVQNWHTDDSMGGKCIFTGTDWASDLINTNWSRIIGIAKGFWQRGNYLIVEFDGHGQFKVIRGAGGKQNFLDCDYP